MYRNIGQSLITKVVKKSFAFFCQDFERCWYVKKDRVKSVMALALCPYAEKCQACPIDRFLRNLHWTVKNENIFFNKAQYLKIIKNVSLEILHTVSWILLLNVTKNTLFYLCWFLTFCMSKCLKIPPKCRIFEWHNFISVTHLYYCDTPSLVSQTTIFVTKFH